MKTKTKVWSLVLALWSVLGLCFVPIIEVPVDTGRSNTTLAVAPFYIPEYAPQIQPGQSKEEEAKEDDDDEEVRNGLALARQDDVQEDLEEIKRSLQGMIQKLEQNAALVDSLLLDRPIGYEKTYFNSWGGELTDFKRVGGESPIPHIGRMEFEKMDPYAIFEQRYIFG